MSLIRGTALQGFVELVEEQQGDPKALLGAVQIPVDAVGDHDSFISYRGVVLVLEAAAVATATPDFGRRLAERQGLEILGPLGVAARTAATVGAALADVEQYLSIYSPALSVTVRALPEGQLARLEWRLRSRRPPQHHQAAELGLGVALRAIRLLAGPDFRPTSVHFRHRALSPVQDYGRSFGVRPRFSAEFNGVQFHRSVLQRRLDSDSGVHRVVQDYLSSIVLPTDNQDVEPARLLIQRMLPTGGLTLELVASHLALHPRTLQRHLDARGTSFAQLVDEIRRDEAERYLRETDVPLGQLAGILGYSEQSVLSRSCRRWFNASPSQARQALRGSTALSE